VPTSAHIATRPRRTKETRKRRKHGSKPPRRSERFSRTSFANHVPTRGWRTEGRTPKKEETSIDGYVPFSSIDPFLYQSFGPRKVDRGGGCTVDKDAPFRRRGVDERRKRNAGEGAVERERGGAEELGSRRWRKDQQIGVDRVEETTVPTTNGTTHRRTEGGASILFERCAEAFVSRSVAVGATASRWSAVGIGKRSSGEETRSAPSRGIE